MLSLLCCNTCGPYCTVSWSIQFLQCTIINQYTIYKTNHHNLVLSFPSSLSFRCSRSLGFIYKWQATTLMHKCIHFKLIFILILILPNITKLIMTNWFSEKCEMVGRQFGSIVDINLSFNNCSYISYLLDGASK